MSSLVIATVEVVEGSERRRPGPRGDVPAVVLAAAEELLARAPLAELKVKDVIERAGIARGSFYAHFDGLSAVVVALIGQVSDEVYDAARSFLEPDDLSADPEPAMREAIANSIAGWRRHPAAFRAAVESWQPEVRAVWSAVVGRFADAVATRIVQERKLGRIPDDGRDPDALAGVLVAMNERCFYFAIVNGQPASDPLLTETLTSVWLAALYGRG